MSVTLVIFSLLSQPLGPEQPISGEPPPCAISEETEALSNQLRTPPKIACDYGVAEFKKRLLSVFGWPAQGLNIETLERTFSLPRLKTGYDAPREASFTAYASGFNGDDGFWSASLHYTESFVPMDAYRRPRFRGSERPVLINPRIRGQRDARIDIIPSLNSSSQPRVCLKASEFIDAAQRREWREPKIRLVLRNPHGNLPLPSIANERGRWRVSIEFDRQNGCAVALYYGTFADLGAN